MFVSYVWVARVYIIGCFKSCILKPPIRYNSALLRFKPNSRIWVKWSLHYLIKSISAEKPYNAKAMSRREKWLQPTYYIKTLINCLVIVWFLMLVDLNQSAYLIKMNFKEIITKNMFFSSIVFRFEISNLRSIIFISWQNLGCWVWNCPSSSCRSFIFNQTRHCALFYIN